MFAPGAPLALAEFRNTNIDIATTVVSIFILGFALGPLISSSLSEIHGRKVVYLASNLLFLVFTIACALSTNLGMLVASRFQAGCAGATPTMFGGASSGDMFSKERRGTAIAIWGMGPLLGPTMGSVIGGFLAQAKGWRILFWLQAAFSGFTLILGAIFLRETYALFLLEQKTKRMIRRTGDKNLVSALNGSTSSAEQLKRATIRPAKIIFLSPFIFVLSVYSAVLFGYLYLFITTFPTVFSSQYGFSISITGFTYLGLGIGCLLGTVLMGNTSDMLCRKLTARNHGISRPEYRLPPLLITSPLIPIAFFMYE